MEPQQLLALVATHVGALSAWAADTSVHGLGAESDENLLATVSELEGIGRLIDSAKVHAAGLLDERTDVGGLEDGLAFKYGFSRSVPFLEHITRISQVDARKRVGLAKNIRARRSMTGEQLPPLVKRLFDSTPTASSWLDHQVKPHMFGELPQCAKPAQPVASNVASTTDRNA